MFGQGDWYSVSRDMIDNKEYQKAIDYLTKEMEVMIKDTANYKEEVLEMFLPSLYAQRAKAKALKNDVIGAYNDYTNVLSYSSIDNFTAEGARYGITNLIINSPQIFSNIKDYKILGNLAYFYYLSEPDYKKSIEYSTKSIKINPNSSITYVLRAFAQQNLDNQDDLTKCSVCLVDLNTALTNCNNEISKTNKYETYLERAYIKFLFKDYYKSIDDCNFVLKKYPNDQIALFIKFFNYMWISLDKLKEPFEPFNMKQADIEKCVSYLDYEFQPFRWLLMLEDGRLQKQIELLQNKIKK